MLLLRSCWLVSRKQLAWTFHWRLKATLISYNSTHLHFKEPCLLQNFDFNAKNLPKHWNFSQQSMPRSVECPHPRNAINHVNYRDTYFHELLKIHCFFTKFVRYGLEVILDSSFYWKLTCSSFETKLNSGKIRIHLRYSP